MVGISNGGDDQELRGAMKRGKLTNDGHIIYKVMRIDIAPRLRNVIHHNVSRILRRSIFCEGCYVQITTAIVGDVVLLPN